VDKDFYQLQREFPLSRSASTTWWLSVDYILVVKRQERESKHSIQSNSEVKTECSYNLKPACTDVLCSLQSRNPIQAQNFESNREWSIKGSCSGKSKREEGPTEISDIPLPNYGAYGREENDEGFGGETRGKETT